jgi:1-acyl-sn-glycerol-3-phosphate acyltransferase
VQFIESVTSSESPYFWPFWTSAAIVLVGGGFIGLSLGLRGREDGAFVAGVRVVFTLYAKVFHGLRVKPESSDPLPAEGAAIVAANHRSGVDPVLIGVTTKRRIHFLMAREYYETWGLRWMFRALGCIPVNRDGNDLGATKAALKLLKEGKVVGIFPQGGIREADGALEGKAGIALLALRTGAPVVPLFIDGSPNLDSVFLSLFKPSRTTIRWGGRLELGEAREKKPSREELDGATATIFSAIGGLKTS